MPPSPLSLEPSRDDDGALFQDARTGFSHLLPGRPALVLPPANVADAAVHLADAPVTLRYKLERPSFAGDAASVARATAARFASWRAQSNIAVAFTNPTWLLAWGVEAAVVATYDVAPGAEREDLFVLVRQAMVYTVTWTYPRGFTEDPAYASFASVAEATMVWDPLRWEQRGRIWPESAIVGPGLRAQARPAWVEVFRRIAEAPVPADDRARAARVLSDVVRDAGAPWVELRADVLVARRDALASAVRDPALRSFVHGAFADVRTAHDLRGLAVLLGQALDARRSSRPPRR